LNKLKSIGRNEYLFFFTAILIFIFANIVGYWKGIPFIAIIPIVLAFFVATIYDYRVIFYSLLVCLSVSLDMSIGPLSLSVPTEPLLMLGTATWLILLLNKRSSIATYINNPLVVLLLLQLLLFTFNIFISKEPTLSLKYLLSKLWFFGGFVFFPILILKDEKSYKAAFWSFFIPLMLSVLYTVINHAKTGFSFDEVNQSARPLYANHVIYACTLGLIFPFAVAAIGWYKDHPKIKLVLYSSILILIFAIITSYTRTTWIAIVGAGLSIIVFKSKFLKLSFIVGIIGLTVFCYKLVNNNNYMKYAPNYSNTNFNKDDFGKHMQATVELRDVSGMERVYRWVAAINLIQHHFWLGTGNNTFYPTYKTYANPSFVTNVSHNPEHSSTHNYFLLVFCDQGVFGFLLFSILYLWAMLKTKAIYLSTNDKFIRTLMTASFAMLVLFLVHLFLGDMIEIEKNGGLFLLVLSFIISSEMRTKKTPQTL
jgi:O-antigen ligase